ncbi:hypothetical protein DFJ77DRAFT_452346 [Powellomyces hirtus]|nr:hypothetical protein DFJ77DRAFT_452346 [Powellomyces hirtus]
MKVFQAESGVLLNVRAFDATESLDNVREEIYSLSSIPPHAQILLLGGATGGVQVKEANIAEILKEESVLFVYNRLLLVDTPDGAAMMPVTPDIEPPVPQKVLVDVHVSSSAALPERCDAYAAAFRSHIAYSQATSRTASYHAIISDRSYHEQQGQAEALNVALTNLKGHSRAICEAFDNFYQHAQKEMAQHAVRIQSFPTDMQALHRLPIHAAIVDGDKYLSDYVPEDKLITWAENCRIAHDNLAERVVTAAEAIKSIRAGTEFEDAASLDVDFKQLESHLTEVRSARQRLDAKHQRLERDLVKVEEILADARSTSSITNEKFGSLSHLLQIHREEYLTNVTESDATIRRLTTVIVNSKAHLSQEILRRLQSISLIQSQIAAITPTLNELSNVLNAHTQAFAQLLHVHRMPAAWGATLVEIVRRREFVRVFISKAKDMAEVLGRYRSQEEKRRETFKIEIARYLPSDLIQGLDDKLPYCEVSLSNTTGTLPDISRQDVNEFEKLITSIHSTMLDNEPGGAAASQTHSNHSISKLIATIVKMLSQVDATPADFERILIKSGFSERMTRLEDENARLRVMAGVRTPDDQSSRTMHISRSPSSGQSDAFSTHQEIVSLRNRLLESEARCAGLERRNQENETLVLQVSELERQLRTEREKSAELESALQFAMDEREHVDEDLADAQARTLEAEQKQNALQADLSKVGW